MTTGMSERQRKHVFFTWAAQAEARGLPVIRAQGAEFFLENGKRYIDFESLVFNANLGHGDPRMVEAIQKQAADLATAAPGFVYEAKAALGERLAEITPPGLNKFFLTLGGAEANENAIKIARLATGRHKIISRYRSYHGATYGALSVTGDVRRLPLEPGMPGVVRVEDPYCYRCPWSQHPEHCGRECVDHIERVIDFEGPQRVAAVLVETITGAAGAYLPPPDYLQRLRSLCDQHGILLIADEVLCGFGRTGKWFAVEHYGVIPDIMTMAKGITGGYAPLGAVAVSEKIADYFEKNTLWAGLTCYGHPLSCAAANAAIDIYRQDRLVERAGQLEAVLAERLMALQQKHEVVDGVRYKGLFSAFEFVHNKASRKPLVSYHSKPGETGKITELKQRLDDLGIYMPIRGSLAMITPPLMIDEALLHDGMDKVDQALTEVFQKEPA